MARFLESLVKVGEKRSGEIAIQMWLWTVPTMLVWPLPDVRDEQAMARGVLELRKRRQTRKRTKI